MESIKEAVIKVINMLIVHQTLAKSKQEKTPSEKGEKGRSLMRDPIIANPIVANPSVESKQEKTPSEEGECKEDYMNNPEKIVPETLAKSKQEKTPSEKGATYGGYMKTVTNNRVAQLTDRFNLARFLNDQFGLRLREDRASGAIRAPYRPDRHPSFSVWPRNGVWFYKDFATGQGGNSYQFLRDVLGLSMGEAIRVMESQVGEVPAAEPVRIPRLERPKEEARRDDERWERERPKWESYLMERFAELQEKGLPERATGRGIGLEEAAMLALGREGDSLVIPIWGADGKLEAVKLGFPRHSGRRYQYKTAGRGTPPWHSPGFAEGKYVLVLEGELNAMVAWLALRDYGVAVMGMAGASTLLPDPSLLEGRRVFVMGDDDRAGIEAVMTWMGQLAQAGVEAYAMAPLQKGRDICEIAEDIGLEALSRSLSEHILTVEQGYGIDAESAEALNRMYHDPYGPVPLADIRAMCRGNNMDFDATVATYMAMLTIAQSGGLWAARVQDDGSFLFRIATSHSQMSELIQTTNRHAYINARRRLAQAGYILEYIPGESHTPSTFLIKIPPFEKWNRGLGVDSMVQQKTRSAKPKSMRSRSRAEKAIGAVRLNHRLQMVIAYLRNHEHRAMMGELAGLIQASLETIRKMVDDYPDIFGMERPRGRARDPENVVYLQPTWHKRVAKGWQYAFSRFQKRVHIPVMLMHLAKRAKRLRYVAGRFKKAHERLLEAFNRLAEAIEKRIGQWVRDEHRERLLGKLQGARVLAGVVAPGA